MEWVDDVVSELPKLASIEEVAKVIRAEPRTVRRLVASAQLLGWRRVKSGTSPVLIPRNEVARYLRSLHGTSKEREEVERKRDKAAREQNSKREKA